MISPLAGARLTRLFPEAVPQGPSGAPRQLATSKQRCETCSIRRSHTNIAVCLLLLAALVSYNWYDILTRRLYAEGSAPVVVSVPTTIPPPAPEPAAVRPAPESAEPPRAVEAAPQRRVRRARQEERPAGPPADLQGLY